MTTINDDGRMPGRQLRGEQRASRRAAAGCVAGGLALSALLICLGHTSPAAGYCANPVRPADFDAAIPVYVATAEARDVSLIGLSDDAVVNAVISQLEIYNHSAAALPRLYFAGTTSADTGDWANVTPRAITVQSSGSACNICGPNNQMACWQSAGDKHRVTLRIPGCGGAYLWKIDTQQFGHNVNNVLLHELGHALGMEHNDEVCPAGYLSSGGSYGVMRSSLQLQASGRMLRRDDVQGLVALWGGREHSMGVRESVDGGAIWSAPYEIRSGLTTRVPVRASSGSYQADNAVRAVGFVEHGSGQVGVLTGVWKGWDKGIGYDVVDGGDLLDSVAVATGRNAAGTRKVMVAWYANESETMMAGNLRWAFKSHTGSWGGWSYADGPNQQSKVVGLGYDDFHRHFVLTTTDTFQLPVVHTLDPDTGVIVGTTYLDDFQPNVMRETVGNAVCYRNGSRARCAIPFTTAGSQQGPCMGWYTLSPKANGTFQLLDTVIDCNSLSHGPAITMASDPRAWGSYGFITNRDTAASMALPWNSAETMGRLFNGSVQTPPVPSYVTFGVWPVAVGSIARQTSQAGAFVTYQLIEAGPPGGF